MRKEELSLPFFIRVFTLPLFCKDKHFPRIVVIPIDFKIFQFRQFLQRGPSARIALLFFIYVCSALLFCNVVATLVVGYGGDVAVGSAGEFEFAVLGGEVDELVAEGGDLTFILVAHLAADLFADGCFFLGEVDVFLHEFADVGFFEVGHGLEVGFLHFGTFGCQL